MDLPHVDTETGKIYGCEENSFKWWHEVGHIEFNQQYSSLLLIKDYILGAWIFFVTVSFVYRFFVNAVAICWAVYFFIGIFEEYWCNQYAKKRM